VFLLFQVQVSGYLNLMANGIDNFMHGLAIGGGFLVSLKMGLLTTLAILVHEVPHEIGDFAILLRSGFSRWEAARAQLATACSGILGALAANVCSMATFGESTSTPKMTLNGILAIFTARSNFVFKVFDILRPFVQRHFPPKNTKLCNLDK